MSIRQVVSILMESNCYWLLSIQERLEIVKTYFKLYERKEA